jgi:hypothetical protein
MKITTKKTTFFILSIALIPFLPTPYTLLFTLVGFAFGFVFTIPFTWLAKKFNSNSKMLLKFTLYSCLTFTAVLWIYYIVRTFTPLLNNFYGYKDFDEFIYYAPFGCSNPLSKFIMETIALIIMTDIFFIGLGAGFIFNACLKIPNLENKKER